MTAKLPLGTETAKLVLKFGCECELRPYCSKAVPVEKLCFLPIYWYGEAYVVQPSAFPQELKGTGTGTARSLREVLREHGTGTLREQTEPTSPLSIYPGLGVTVGFRLRELLHEGRTEGDWRPSCSTREVVVARHGGSCGAN